MTNLNESRAAPRSQRDMASSNCYSGIYLRGGAALQGLNIDGPSESEDIAIRDVSDDSQRGQPRKRAAVGDGISAGSGSPYRESPSPPPR
jgi:hypothetical protein